MAVPQSFLRLGIVFIVLACFTSTSNGRTLPTSPRISHRGLDLFPSRNMTGGPTGEIQCYSLPYGGMGIFSHLLTYHTMAWIALGRRPLWPWHGMGKFYKFDLTLALVTLISTIPIASITIHRCRLSWQFVFISIGMLMTSVSLAAIAIHRALIMRKENKTTNSKSYVGLRNLGENIQHARSSFWNALSHSWLNPNSRQRRTTHPSWFHREPHHHPKNRNPLWWLVLFLFGTVLSISGLGSLVYATLPHNATIKHLTYGFGTIILAIPLCVTAYWWAKHFEQPRGGWRVWLSACLYGVGGAVVAFIATFGVFAPLYCDLVLGAIADNVSGLPSGDIAVLYWAWFAFKRVPMLAF